MIPTKEALAAYKLEQLEKLIMKWPRAIRIQLALRTARLAAERAREAELRSYRGLIKRSLKEADLATLKAMAGEITFACAHSRD